MKELSISTIYTLEQLQTLLGSLTSSEYNEKLEILNGNTIGKHYRHIIELFQSLFGGIDKKLINYDHRPRSVDLETNIAFCMDQISMIKDQISALKDRDFTLSLSSEISEELKIKTSYNRELLYNLEHTIHHMAIIGIVVRQSLKHLQLDSNFGVAFSTIKYQQQLACAQ